MELLPAFMRNALCRAQGQIIEIYVNNPDGRYEDSELRKIVEEPWWAFYPALWELIASENGLREELVKRRWLPWPHRYYTLTEGGRAAFPKFLYFPEDDA
ncbi:MAG: hypothetical protein M3460_29235 [Actinomycetota bacterium]|nr:hypothetical protein [Actinomycetota bacterium]